MIRWRGPGGVAGIAQVEPRDAHLAALCSGEQPAHRALVRAKREVVDNGAKPRSVWAGRTRGVDLGRMSLSGCAGPG